MKSILNLACPLAVVGFAMASLAGSAFAAGPLIAQYGAVAPVTQPGELPDTALDYKVVMNVTSAGPEGAPPPALEAAARLANLLTQSGVPAGHRHIVVVLHGAATSAVLNEAAAKAKGRGVNPSADLISKLTEAGIQRAGVRPSARQSHDRTSGRAEGCAG